MLDWIDGLDSGYLLDCYDNQSPCGANESPTKAHTNHNPNSQNDNNENLN